ncbi:MAG: glycosyl hydrolase, partial [Planctomycetota bacterium]
RWTRMPAGGRPAVLRTSDGGETWERQTKGLPRSDTWWTVKRQALATDGYDPLGVYFGTSSGEVWASTSGGARWKCIARGLPHVYSVEIG